MSRPQPISSALAVSGPRRPPPERVTGIVAWLRTNLFNNMQNSVMTLLAVWALLVTLPGFVNWAVIEAVWITDDSRVCRAAAGACWAVITEKHRVMLFGTFPYDEHWRGVLVIAIVIGLSIFSAFKRFWSYWLFAAWLGAMAIILVLQLGGIFGLKETGTHDWGGLPLTLILFVVTVVGGLPMAILLALGRRSALPVLKSLCIGMIEITRVVPLITMVAHTGRKLRLVRAMRAHNSDIA